MLYRERVDTAVRLSRAPEASLIASIPPTLARPEWSQSVDFVSVNGRSSSAGSSDEDSHGDPLDIRACANARRGCHGKEELVEYGASCGSTEEERGPLLREDKCSGSQRNAGLVRHHPVCRTGANPEVQLIQETILEMQ